MKTAYRKNSRVIVLTDEQLQGLGIVSPVPLGQWNSAIKYQKLNIVRYNGASYIARTSNINVEPTVSPIWQNVWMAVAYDGGSISPDGTYPEMTVGNATNAQSATKATQDGNGNNIVDTYARQNGTYPNMTVGNATNAVKATQDSNGNNIADTYAQKNNLLVAHYITVDLANTFHFVCTLINKSTTSIGSKSALLQALQDIGNQKGVAANGFLFNSQKGGAIFEIVALSSTILRIRTVATPDVGSVQTFDYDTSNNAIGVGDVVISY